MNRPWALFVLVVLLAGCRTPPQGDPFLLGRSTIPPPGTGAIGPQGAQSLAPPTVTVPPAQSMPAAASPTMNTVPTAPLSPATNAPPVNNPYNFHQGSYQKAAPEPIAGDWTPSRQTVATTNRATTQDTSPTIVTAAKTATGAVAEATDMESNDESSQSTIKVTSFQDSAERISLKTDAASSTTASNGSNKGSEKNLTEPNRFVPSGTVIRIVEPGAKADGDSANLAKPTATMTASSFQPQWQKWTVGATE
jgi:hypothetical protein